MFGVVVGFFTRYWRILAVVAVITALSAVLYRTYNSGYDNGQNECKLEQLENQKTHNDIVKKTLRKIDNEVPVTADRAARSEWMRSIGRREDTSTEQ